MISHRGRFVFVHVNKTAGTSVEHALASFVDEPDVPRHHTARWARARLGAGRFGDYFRFAVVRDPWDRMVSLYHFRREQEGNAGPAKTASFGDWLRRVHERWASGVPETDKRSLFTSGDQVRWLTGGALEADDPLAPGDEDGPLLVDLVVRFEELARGWEQVCERLGVTRELPHLKRSRRGHYADYYDAELARLVAQMFACDVRRFGYRFAGDAG